jgi:signal transduction histidine kinase
MGLLSVRWPTSTDVALAVAFAVAAEVELRVYDLPIVAGHVAPASDSMLVLAPLVPLAWRRASPFAAVVSMPLVVTAVGLAGGTVCFFSTMLPFVFLMYAAATWSRSPWDVLALLAAVVLLAPMVTYARDFGPNDWVFGLVVASAAWIAGQGARRWRSQSQQLAAALAEAEAGRDAQAELAVAEERARIARELHDVVAHGMSVMVMQAGAARPAVDDDPAQVATALARIEEVGRNAMLEMRRLLGILRDDDAEARHPQPRLNGMPMLLEEVSAAGLAVAYQVEGHARPLPDAQEVSAYRILQEALTNALRHGAGDSAAVTLSWLDDRIRIEVSNPVRPGWTNGDTRGHGLVGIRERAALFDGRFSAGARAGRYRVMVELPYDGDLT